MQKNTLDTFLGRSTGPSLAYKMVGSDANMEDVKSLQSPPEIQSENGLDQYDESLTDIDMEESQGNTDGLHLSPEVFPSIFGRAEAPKGTDLLTLLNGNRKPIQSSMDQQTLDIIDQENTIDQLEKKVYKANQKGVNLKDFLLWGKQKPPETIVLASEGDYIEDDASSELIPVNLDTKTIESKVYLNHKKVSAKDLLKSNRKSTPTRQFNVTLKVDKDALAFYKKFENPLKTRGNSQYIRSKQYNVVLRIDGTKLKRFQAQLNTIKPVKQVKNANSIFSSMMKNSAAGSVKLTPLQKLKELEPPTLKRDEFHVFEEEKYELLPGKLLLFKERTPIPTNIDETFDLESDCGGPMGPRYVQSLVVMERSEAIERFSSICNPEVSLFSHLHNKLFEPHDSEVLWPQLFEPLKTESLLILAHNQQKLKSWLGESFSRLKSQSFKGPRKKKRAKANDKLKDFIVDDDIYETEEEIFLPVMVVHGETGVGKTASIYTAMKEMGGYVYEINSSQTRSRRDLLSTLKELCTTQLIHKKDQDGDFQKGIVLLDDCDILFEQDRTFWTVVQEVLEITRRPIALTCSDISVIPNLIREAALENDAILNLNKNRPSDIRIYKDYLWGCGFTQGYDLDDSVLEAILSHNESDVVSTKFDIRRSLLLCQMTCQAKEPPQLVGDMVELIKVESNEPIPTKKEPSLREVSQYMDMLSVVDNLETNIPSQLNHAEIKNEFIDVYYIDETTKLKQCMLPHELKTCKAIHDIISQKVPNKLDTVPLQLQHNQIRRTVNDFIGSRSKPIPQILLGLQFSREGPRMTRSNVDNDDYEFWKPEPTGIMENSLLNYLSPAAHILDLSPFARNWCGFQLCLDRFDKDLATRTKMFIQWREFQNKSNRVLKTITTKHNWK